MNPTLVGIGNGTVSVSNLSSGYLNVTNGTTVIKNGSGSLYGIIVNSHTSGIINLWDGTTPQNGTPIGGAITLAAGPQQLNMFGLTFNTACCLQLAGTANVTVCYK